MTPVEGQVGKDRVRVGGTLETDQTRNRHTGRRGEQKAHKQGGGDRPHRTTSSLFC